MIKPRPMTESLEPRRLLSAITNWTSRGPGGGGAFFSPSFSPFNSNEIYTVSDMSGLYHSTSLGQSWTMSDFRQIQGGIGSSVQFTSDPNVLYTLDYSNTASGGSSTAPSKSTDAGVTWKQLSGWNGANDQAYSLFANPANTTQLLASDYGHLFYSGNGGTSFTQVFTDNSGAGCYVGGVFWDGSNIDVGTDVGLLISSNGGSSFALSTATGLPGGSSILSFTGSKAGGVVRLACITANSGDVFAGLETGSVGAGSYSGTWTITPGNSSWTAATSVPSGDGPLIISMAQNDISDIYLGGTNYATSFPIIAKSTDGGHTFSNVLNTTNNGNIATGWQGSGGDRQWSFDQLTEGFEVDPANINNLAFSGFGYLHLSTDGGQTWRQAYVNPADQNALGTATPQHKAYRGVGLEDTSALYLNWANAQTITAGYTDIYGVRSTDGGQSWAFPTGFNLAGNTVYCVTKVGNTLYAATSSTHDIYQSTHTLDSTLSGNGNVIYSVDSGATWNVLHSFSHPVVWVASDPNDANRLYASVANNVSGGVYTTANLSAGTGATWTATTAPPRTHGHAFNIDVLNDGSIVATFSAQRLGSTFNNSSGVFISTDHGVTWIDRTGAGMQWWTKDITIDPADPTQSAWYAGVRFAYGTSGASGSGGLYRTTNRGQTWTKIFQSVGVESTGINPTTGEMYVATEENGLYYTANPKAGTPTFTQTTYPFRQPERIFFNPYNSNEVWIASFGYGLAVGTVSSGVTVNSNDAYIKLDADAVHMDIWNNLTATGLPTQYLLASVSSVTYAGPAGNDNLVLDFSAGDPLPTVGLTYTGGTGQNTLKIIGTTNNDALAVNATNMVFSTTAFGPVPIAYTAATMITFDGDSAGSDVLTQSAQPAAALVFANSTLSDSLNVSTGTFTVAAASGGGFNAIALGGLSIGAGAKVVLANAGLRADRTVLTTGNLSIAGGTGNWLGTLDLTGNDLVINNGNLPQLTDQIHSGLTSGGVSSSLAAASINKQTTLGIELNNDGNGHPLFGSAAPLQLFDGQNPTLTDVLVKYTYWGDANLDGHVDGSDYSRIDNGVGKLTGWFNGDFNGDSIINGSDYTLIDNVYNAQGVSLAGSSAGMRPFAVALNITPVTFEGVEVPSIGMSAMTELLGDGTL